MTSLHYHLPWLVKALIRWSLYCAATKRKMRHDLGWADYFAVAEAIDDPVERLEALGKLARERFDADRFDRFCADNLAGLDRAALDFFGTERAREIIRRKVATLFPTHEVDEFTDHFYGLIQFWRHTRGGPARRFGGPGQGRRHGSRSSTGTRTG